MQVITTCAEMTALCREAAPRPLGLVPTMGALHEGHLSLTQPGAGRQRHPGGVHIRESQPVRRKRGFHHLPAQHGARPGVAASAGHRPRIRRRLPDEVYPDGFDTWIEPGAVAEGMEGAARPGHFRGVATVVAKLFTITRPDRAYFGQKRRPAGSGHPQDERRSQPRRSGSHHAHHPRTRRPRPEQPQRLPDPAATRRRPGNVPRPASRRIPVALRRTQTATACKPQQWPNYSASRSYPP